MITKRKKCKKSVEPFFRCSFLGDDKCIGDAQALF